MAINPALLLEQLGVGSLTESAGAGSNPLLAALASRLTESRPAPDDARLQRRLRAQAAVLRRAAELLGACPACLGLEPGCRACRGRGGPGSAPTEARALAIWLAPIAPDLDTPSQPIRTTHQGEHR